MSCFLRIFSEALRNLTRPLLDHVLIPMGSTVKMSSPVYMPRAFEGLPCDQLSEGQKARVWLTDGSACHVGTTQKGKAAVLQTLSGITLKDTSEEGVFTVGRTSCRTHGLTFFLEEEMARCAVY